MENHAESPEKLNSKNQIFPDLASNFFGNLVTKFCPEFVAGKFQLIIFLSKFREGLGHITVDLH